MKTYATRSPLKPPPVSMGRALEPRVRTAMESRLGHDFSNVRVFSDSQAAESARMLGANAYASGENLVFGAGGYDPGSPRGLRLLGHELAHVAQQRNGSGSNWESRARSAGDRVARGETVSPEALGGAPAGIHMDDEAPNPDAPKKEHVRVFKMPISNVAPYLFQPPFGAFDLGPPLFPTLPLFDPSHAPLAPTYTPITIPPLTTPGGAPSVSLPSRISLLGSGRFSFGARIGLPDISVEDFYGGESRIAELTRQAKIINQQLSGVPPSLFDTIDFSKLVKVSFSILSTHIAPDLFRSLASKLSRPGPKGMNYQLDATFIPSDAKGGVGGGLTFTITPLPF